MTPRLGGSMDLKHLDWRGTRRTTSAAMASMLMRCASASLHLLSHRSSANPSSHFQFLSLHHRRIICSAPVSCSTGSVPGYRNETAPAVELDMAHIEKKEVVAGQSKVGWIGTGVMGQAMCGHILDAGFSLTVFNRTASKAEGLCKRGATMADSPSAVAENSDVVFTIVGYPGDVREVILGEKGILQSLRPGGIVVDMTTSEPSLAREIFALAQKKGCDAVDAPVSGGDKGAKAGTLAIMAGGQEDTIRALAPLLKCMGSVTFMGPAGSGQSCKLANQVTIASTMVGLVEGMLYAHKAGLDVTTYLQAIAGGAAGSKSLDLYAGRIQDRDFAPGFYVNHFVKDLGIALEECKQMGLALPGLALAQQLYVSLKAYDEGNLGTQSLIKALERLNNLTLPQKISA